MNCLIRARDGFFFKDGRGWHTSESSRGRTLAWPYPATLRGALRTVYGRGQETDHPFTSTQWVEQTRGLRIAASLPLLRSSTSTEWQRLWPFPADALLLDGEPLVYRLEPRAVRHATLGRDEDPAREQLWWPRVETRSKPRAAPTWWGEADFVHWLTERPVAARTQEEYLALAPKRREMVRLAIDVETQAAEEAKLFSHEIIETMGEQGEWAIGCQVAWPKGEETAPGPHGGSSLLTFGSDRRLAELSAAPNSLFDCPLPAMKASKGLRLLTVTPTLFGRGWLPDGLQVENASYVGRLREDLDDWVLRAAFVGRPVHHSGWQMAPHPQPKDTLRLVPPGAVYFFERKNGCDFEAELFQRLWLTQLGGQTEDGWGCVVAAPWNQTR
jgi:CRISPR-associated protein Cmr3